MNAVIQTQTPHQTNTQNVAANTPAKEAPKAQLGARHFHNVEMFNRSINTCCIRGAFSTVAGVLASGAYASLTALDERDFKLKFTLAASTSIGLALFAMGAQLVYLSVTYINVEKALISNAPDTEPTESTIKNKND